VKRLDDAWVCGPEADIVSEIQILVIRIPMADEDLTAVHNKDRGPTVPEVCMADIDFRTDDLHGGSILRRDPR
jgi:hypothetical protein